MCVGDAVPRCIDFGAWWELEKGGRVVGEEVSVGGCFAEGDGEFVEYWC